MEFKGINWAGNIYQKFEAMCLEVEEVIYEDTVKYVESQVQKVGGSVKKFYAEIMQDLLPPSCVDPVKVAAGDLPLNPYCHLDFNKKPKPSDRDGQLKKKDIEDIPDFAQEELRMCVHEDANRRLSPTPTVLVENIQSDGHYTKSKKLGAYRSSVGIKRVPKNNRPPKASSPVISSPGDESNLVCQRRSGHEEAVNKSVAISATSVEHMSSSPRDESNLVNDRICDPEEAVNKSVPVSAISFESMSSLQGDKGGPVCDGRCNPIEAVNKSVPISATSVEPMSSSPGDKGSPVCDGRCDPEVAVYKSVPSAGILVEFIASENISTVTVRQLQDDSNSTSTVSEKILPTETLMQNKVDPQYTASFHDLPAKTIGASMNEPSVHDIECAGMVFCTPKECLKLNKFGKNESSFKENPDIFIDTDSTESACGKIIVPYEDNFDAEFIMKDEVAEPGIETFNPIGTSKLEETCILVEADKLHFTPQVTEKHKPYKVSCNLSQKKIREALASRLKQKKKPPHSLAEAVHGESLAPDSFESDWELL